MINTHPDIGVDLAVLGSAISCVGVIFNNIFLNHILAMQIWMLGNPILLIWAYGSWKKYWENGLSGCALTCMYSVFTISTLWGLIYA